MIGTQTALGVGPSSDALLFVICCPVNISSQTNCQLPIMTSADPVRFVALRSDLTIQVCSSVNHLTRRLLVTDNPAAGFKPVSLLATTKYVRAAPGGTGGYKLGSKYVAASIYPSIPFTPPHP